MEIGIDIWGISRLGEKLMEVFFFEKVNTYRPKGMIMMKNVSGEYIYHICMIYIRFFSFHRIFVVSVEVWFAFENFSLVSFPVFLTHFLFPSLQFPNNLVTVTMLVSNYLYTRGKSILYFDCISRKLGNRSQRKQIPTLLLPSLHPSEC